MASAIVASATVFAVAGVAAASHKHSAGRAAQISLKVVGIAHRPLRAGDWIVLRWSVTNLTNHKLKASTLRYYFSPSRSTAPGGSFALSGESLVPALSRGETARGKARLRVPKSAGRGKGKNHRAAAARAPGASGALYLIGCVGPSCGSSAAPVPVSCGAASGMACPDLSGQVLYEKRNCYFGQKSEAPLPDARLVLTSANGATQEVPLGRDGTYRGVKLSGTLPIKAKVILDNAQIAVRPDTTPAGPYELPLGDAARLDPSTGRVVSVGRLVARGDGPAGAASIFAILDRGAQIAADASPVALPKVTARWRFGKRLDRGSWLGDRPPPSQYDPNSNQIFISGFLVGPHPNRDEFEANVLLHEYAHHVMRYVADVTPTGNSHTLTSTYPNDPALPWSEGFADAFAAIVAGDPRPTLGCKAIQDLSTFPASASDQTTKGMMEPQPSAAKFLPVSPGLWVAGDPLAQYNETVDAGVVWQVVSALGGFNAGIPSFVLSDVLQAGLKRFLGALATYHQSFGGPVNMRQVRDALIIGGAEQSQADHDTLSGAFAAEGVVGFGAGVRARFSQGGDGVCVVPWDPSNPSAGGCEESSVISINGPGYSCKFRTPQNGQSGSMHKYTDGLQVGSGAIPYAWQDDCYASSEEIWLRLPFVTGEGHLGGPYTATLQLNCRSHVYNDPNTGQIANGKCPSTYHLEIKLDTTQAVGDGETILANGFGVFSATTDVGANSTTTVATFKADGSSCTFAGGNCGP